jgi:hypothetical protein
MPINDWWLDDPAQKYWMEITDRDDLGGEVRAPQKSDDGRPEWGYELVRYARPGDVVLHWYTKHEPRALVGYSRVAGPVQAGMWTWASKGTSGRSRQAPEVDEPAWMTPLTGFTSLPRRLTRKQLQDYKAPVLDLKARLEEAYGDHVYYPFYLYGGRELRATQAYMAKFPSQLLTVLELGEVVGPQKDVRKGRHFWGRLRVWPAWQADFDRLMATRYRYQLPDYEHTMGMP